MTQGDPLSPNIFNVMVDALVCHWESLVAGEMRWGKSDDNKGGQPMEGRMI